MADPRDCDHIGNVSTVIEGDYQITRCNKCGADLHRTKL